MRIFRQMLPSSNCDVEYIFSIFAYYFYRLKISFYWKYIIYFKIRIIDRIIRKYRCVIFETMADKRYANVDALLRMISLRLLSYCMWYTLKHNRSLVNHWRNYGCPRISRKIKGKNLNSFSSGWYFRFCALFFPVLIPMLLGLILPWLALSFTYGSVDTSRRERFTTR